MDNCPPLGSSDISMKGMRGDIILSSKGVKFRHSCFTGKFLLLALEQTSSFPSLRFEWKVKQTHSVLFTLVLPGIHTTNRFFVHLVYLLASYFVTGDQCHN